MYDKDFCIHMAKFTKRSWSIILQQAWMVRLREKIKISGSDYHNHGQKSAGQHRQNDFCKQWNRTGRCSFGRQCKFDHRCSYCFKFGHSVINCRKLRAERDDRRDNRRSNGDRFEAASD